MGETDRERSRPLLAERRASARPQCVGPQLWPSEAHVRPWEQDLEATRAPSPSSGRQASSGGARETSGVRRTPGAGDVLSLAALVVASRRQDDAFCVSIQSCETEQVCVRFLWRNPPPKCDSTAPEP